MWRLRTEEALPLLNGILGISDRLEPRDTSSPTSGGRREALSDGSAGNICAMLAAKLMYFLRLKFFPSKSGSSLSPAFSMTTAILTMRYAILQSSRRAVSATPDKSMAAVGHTSVKDGAIESLHSASQLRCQRTVCRQGTRVFVIFFQFTDMQPSTVSQIQKNVCLVAHLNHAGFGVNAFFLFEYPARSEIFHFR